MFADIKYGAVTSRNQLLFTCLMTDHVGISQTGSVPFV